MIYGSQSTCEAMKTFFYYNKPLRLNHQRAFSCTKALFHQDGGPEIVIAWHEPGHRMKCVVDANSHQIVAVRCLATYFANPCGSES